eukprot:scaffold1589_cov56-Phaeocystis_antarctica.AAC.1
MALASRGTLKPSPDHSSSGSPGGTPPVVSIHGQPTGAKPSLDAQPSGSAGSSARAAHAKPHEPAVATPTAERALLTANDADSSHTIGGAACEPVIEDTSCRARASAGSGKSDSVAATTMMGRSIASSACGALSRRNTAGSLELPSSRMAPAPAELRSGASCHAVWYMCRRAVVAAELSTRVRKPTICALPTPSPPPSATSAAFVPDASATAHSTPAAGPRISTPSTANGRRRQSTAARRRGRPGAPACPPARRAAATAPSPRRRRPPTPPLSLETQGLAATRPKTERSRAPKRRQRGSTAPAPPPAPTAATPPRPPPPIARCSAPPPHRRHHRCAPRTRRPRAARTPPTPRPLPPAPAAAGRTQHSAPRPTQREEPRRSMPRAPSPGEPRQGRRCAHARYGQTPARAADRPRANGRGPRSPREPAAGAAATGGPDRPTGRRDGGSGALHRHPYPQSRRPTCSAAVHARSCRCTRTTTRRPPARPPRFAPSPPGPSAAHTPRRRAAPRPPAG